jgi:sec-independent protein translocase protein TatA
MLPELGPWELNILLVVGLLFFGNRLPEVMRALGKGIDVFKNGPGGRGPWAGV